MTGDRPERPEPRRRRSRAVDLVLIGFTGTAASFVGGCSKATYQRNVYDRFQDCAADYSDTVCREQGRPAAGAHFGPVYRLVGGIPSACRAGDPGGGKSFGQRRVSTQIERGGFGVACRSWGSSNRSSGRSWFGG